MSISVIPMITIKRLRFLVILLAVLGPCVSTFGDDAKNGIDSEGYVCKWLVLAPIPIKEGQEGAEALGQEQIPGEANLKPKGGDTIEVAGKSLTWKECQTNDQVLDFNDILGQKTENGVAYAVTFITADADLAGLTLKLGSDDQVKVYLNGKEIHSNDEGRALEKDEDDVPGVSLKKGLNVLAVKVVNEEEDWALSVRFLDKDDKPAIGLKVTTQPGSP
jgi:hypothetical protein